MVTFVVITIIFLIVSSIFGRTFANFLLGLCASAAVGGVAWFCYGISTGNSSLEVFTVTTVISYVFLGLPLLRNKE